MPTYCLMVSLAHSLFSPGVGIKLFCFGRFLASISAQVWKNITKNTKNADFKKTGPHSCPSHYSPAWPPGESKHFLGGFWHLSKLKFEEIPPKIPRMYILRKLSHLWPTFTLPPGLSGSQNYFWEVSGIYHSSSLKKYHQNCKECRF